AIVGDQRGSKGFVKNDVSSFRPQCYANCISQLVYTGFQCFSGIYAIFNFLSHDSFLQFPVRPASKPFFLFSVRFCCRPGIFCFPDFYYFTTARISFCFTIMYSSSSTFTSVPAYLEKMTWSPTFTCIVTSLPSTTPPGPTAITSACWGFSFA